MARRATSAWAAGTVRLTTISTSGWSSTVAVSPARATPCSAALARATSGRTSPIATTVVSGNRVRFDRYSELIVPAPTIPTPTGPVRPSGTGEAQHVSPAVTQRLEQIAVRVVQLQDSQGRRGRGQDLRDREHARAGRALALRVERPVAVLYVDRCDPIAEPLEQRRHVGAAGERPVGVDLENDARLEVVGEDLERVPAVDPRLELEVVVVVADPESFGGRPVGGGVQLVGDPLDLVGRLPARRVHPRLDHGPDPERGRGLEYGAGIGGEQIRVGGRSGQAVRCEPAGQPLRVLDQPERLDETEADPGDRGQGAVDVRVERRTDRVELDRQVGRVGHASSWSGGGRWASVRRPRGPIVADRRPTPERPLR